MVTANKIKEELERAAPSSGIEWKGREVNERKKEKQKQKEGNCQSTSHLVSLSVISLIWQWRRGYVYVLVCD